MKTYFNNYPYTAESLKKEYRELAKKLHPDTGGDADEFAEMQNEYNEVLNDLNGDRREERAQRRAQEEARRTVNDYETSHHAAHVTEARRHQAEGSQAPKVGAFVFGVHSGLKADGGRGIFEEFEVFASHPEYFEEEEGKEPHIYKVCEVYEVSAADFARPGLADELVKKAHDEGREFAGGSATDDPDRRDPWNEYRYYYTKVAAVVCRESGRWYMIDAEGYSYARYCILPKSWRTMFADELAEEQRKEAERVAEEERREAEEKAARFAEYLEKCAKYDGLLEDVRPLREAAEAARRHQYEEARAHGYRSTQYKSAQKATLKAEAALMAARKRNLQAMAAAIYPGIKTKARKSDRYYGAFDVTYFDGPRLDIFNEATNYELFAEGWTGSDYSDGTTYHREEFTDFATKYMGTGYYDIEVEREWSDATRDRLTAAVLEAVPAAEGCNYDNRHEWTPDELRAAAAATGGNVSYLMNTYNRAATYFNYVDVERVARWCFESMDFEVTEPKAKNTQKTAQEPATESEPKDSKPADTERKSEGEKGTAVDLTKAPADGLRLVSIPGGVAVVGDSWKDTYFNKRYIKAHGAHWNGDAKQWQATDPDDITTLRAWFYLHGRPTDTGATIDDADRAAEDRESEPTPDEPDTTTDTNGTGESSAPLEGSREIIALFDAVAGLFKTLATISREAARWEGVTIPAATLKRWHDDTERSTTATAARFAEVCACLASLTPEARQDFDALGVIFWTLAEQLRTGSDAATIAPAVEFARAQLFELISRTQNEHQAEAVRAALDPDNYPDFMKGAA